jgi:hypothetical protein
VKGDKFMMKVKVSNSSPTLFKNPENNDLIDHVDVDALLQMTRSAFTHYFENNPEHLKLALSNDKLFPKFDNYVVSGLAHTSEMLCKILIESKKFDDKPVFKVILCYKDQFKFRKTLPLDLRSR